VIKTLTLISASFLALSLSAQMPADQQQAIVLKRTIERNHYSPRAVDDSFSADVFQKVIRQLDASSILFTADEWKRLSAFRTLLDDELRGAPWRFVPELTNIYARALHRADSLVDLALQSPLDVNADERGTINPEGYEPHFLNSVAELRQYWTKRFKWEMLNAAYDAASAAKVPLRQQLAKQEAALRQKIKRQAQSGLRQYATTSALAEHVKEVYLTALSTSFDPHTSWFSPVEAEAFKSSLSTQERIYGFLLDDKEGKVVISNLVQGGPAWKSGSVHTNDQVLQVGFEGKEPQDVSLLSAEEVNEMIGRSPAGLLDLRLRRSDGNILQVSLRKEKVEVEENSAKGYVLKGPRTVGYLSLPDFYTSWDGEKGSGCANDVAREIVNLKKEGIEGLILDVRFNGGGSMEEALQLIGIFIDEGPLFGVKDKTGKVSFLKDPNRSTIWDGPLLVLINGQSASASESLAGSLQDYHRALVVGSNSFGKATMQQIIPVDTVDANNRNPAFGFVKITGGKLFRLDGSTAQLSGVHPDIALPDAFDILPYHERLLPNALPADSGRRNNYYKALPPLPVARLQASSASRLQRNAGFAEYEQMLTRLDAFYRNQRQAVPLKLEAFEKWRQQNDIAGIDKDPQNEKPTALFTVINHQREQQRLQNNAYAKELADAIAKHLLTDLHLEEAYNIINELIQGNPNK
jgi:carboxyl-terminal processing protease